MGGFGGKEMKDVPALVWILGGFIAAAVALFLYAPKQSAEPASVSSVWLSSGDVRERLDSRELKLNLTNPLMRSAAPFRILVQRLNNSAGPVPSASYLVSIRPLSRNVGSQRPLDRGRHRARAGRCSADRGFW